MTVTQLPFLPRVSGDDPEFEPSPVGTTFTLQIDITGLPTDQQLRLQALAWALQLEATRAPYPSAGPQPGHAVVSDAARYADYLTTGAASLD